MSKANTVVDVQHGNVLQITKKYLKQTQEYRGENYRVLLTDLWASRKGGTITAENYDDPTHVNPRTGEKENFSVPIRNLPTIRTIGCTRFDQENYDKIMKAARKAAKK